LIVRRLPHILVGLTLVALYTPTLASLGRAWWTDTYAAHGLFVPFFSLFLGWREWGSIRTTGRGHPTGLLLITGAVALLGAGTWQNSLFVQGLAVAPVLAGLVAWILGLQALRVLAFPIAFLLFMAPLPRSAVEAVTLKLQLFAAGFAASSLRLLDIPVYQSGVLIELPSITLEVAEICNGLRFLTALLVLTTAFAHLTQRTIFRKLVLALSAIPIAIFANATRVAVIAVATQYIGPEAASGTIHNFLGKLVWALTLVPLAGLGVFLAMTGPGSRPWRGTAPEPSAADSPRRKEA
jgi:exosortase